MLIGSDNARGYKVVIFSLSLIKAMSFSWIDIIFKKWLKITEGNILKQWYVSLFVVFFVEFEAHNFRDDCSWIVRFQCHRIQIDAQFREIFAVQAKLSIKSKLKFDKMRKSICYLYKETQLPAVRIKFSLIKDPPQNCRCSCKMAA